MTIVEPVPSPSSQRGLHDLIARGDHACASRLQTVTPALRDTLFGHGSPESP
jgi:hypothetical protein